MSSPFKDTSVGSSRAERLDSARDDELTDSELDGAATRFPGMSDDLCTYDVADGVAVLSFNRPESMNGMTGNMEVAYFERAQEDRQVRVIVVTGKGRAFCPGADLAHRPGPDDHPLPNETIARTTPLDITKPMIAAINGACAGAGLAYALQCDLRFTVAGAKFTTAFARRGLIAEYGVAWLLNQIVGRAVAADLLLSARVLRSDEAEELGLVNRVIASDELMDTVMTYATDLAVNVSPASMATIKHQLNTEVDMTAHEALANAEELMTESHAGSDVGEGIASFLERRPVAFPSLGEGTTFGWMDD